MNVDDSGYITFPTHKPIQSEYSEAVHMLVHHLNEVFHSQIHSIYLYGSVANGNAVLGESDLDVTVIFNISIDPLVNKKLANIHSVVCSKYIKISKIDFDCASLEEALSPSNHLSWGYWLKHHCFCIFGYDLSQDIERFKPSLELAIAINGDFSDVIHQLEIDLIKASSKKQRLLTQRSIARKIIRATNILRNKTDNDWPSSLLELYEKFISKYPFLSDSIQFFLRESSHPNKEADDFLKKSRSFVAWLDSEYQSKLKANSICK